MVAQREGNAESFGGSYGAPRRSVKPLVMCWGCRQYVQSLEQVCPFCRADVVALAADRRKKLDEVRHWAAKLRGILDRAGIPQTGSEKPPAPPRKKKTAARKAKPRTRTN